MPGSTTAVKVPVVRLVPTPQQGAGEKSGPGDRYDNGVPQMQLPVRFGKYELLEFLGGGMSRVYRARDTVLMREVAVKILTPEGIADADTRARFLQEAKVSAGLVHDNVIRIFDYGEEQGWPFIVMEFLVGSDLKHAIRDKTTGDLSNRLRILIEGAPG